MSTSSWIGTMPNTAEQVVGVQQSAFSFAKPTTDFGIGLFEQNISRLESLYSQLLNQESAFYSKLGLPQGAQGLRVLQQRLDELNSDYGFRSMSNLSDGNIDQLVMAALNEVDLTAPIQLVAKENFENQQALDEFFNSINMHPADIGANELIDAFRAAGQKVTSATRINKSSSGTRGLSKYLGKITLFPGQDPKHGGIKVELLQALPKTWISRLENEYGLIIQSIGATRQEILRKWLQQNIHNSQIKYYVMNEFNVRANNYDLNGSSASIKGFLGEVRAAAFMSYLCGGRRGVIPTGLITKIKTGEQIPIDLVVKGFGFQIKNYRLTKEGRVTFQHRDAMGAGNFIVDRMRPGEGIAQTLNEFFGSWAFNQPVDGEIGNYYDIYNVFGNYVDRFTSVFEQYEDNILKISDEFQGNSNLFANPGVYYNTFFMIGDRFVPASAIVRAIIQQLQNGNTDSLIQSSFNITAPSAGGETWQRDATSTTTAAIELANRAKVAYFITLNVGQIIEAALATVNI